jgi:hypothetical protein
MRTPRTLARNWCDTGVTSWSDLNGRIRAVLEAGGSPKGAGRHTPPATENDAAVLVLAPLVATFWKDVPAGIRRYGGLMASGGGATDDFENRFGTAYLGDLHAQFKNRTLLQALAFCLRTFHSGSSPEIRFLSLNIERSKYQAKASLYLGDPPTQFVAHFAEPPREGIQPDSIVESIRMRGFALTAMADLLADNLQPKSDTGPSAPTDEPGHPMLKTPLLMGCTPMDRHGAPTPKPPLTGSKLCCG